MSTNASGSYAYNDHLTSETTWRNLYPALRSLARYLIYSFALPAWKGQEEDLIEDVVQETMRRLIERARKAERGEAPPIQSLEHMMVVIARNYCKDLRRHDYKVSRDFSTETRHGMADHPFEFGTENAYQEMLFMLVAHEIANFPDKQRNALLVDLANCMSFDAQPTPLQKAFLEVGIQLQQYRQPLPSNPRERSRHAALLHHAYRRVAHLPCVQEYIAA